MAEELQQLLEKIQKDGVEKANAEAASILTDAKAKADALVKDAEAKSAGLLAKAQAEADAYAARARETVSQAVRDTLKSIEDSVTAMLEHLLAQNVDVALSDPAVAGPIAADAIKSLAAGQPAEISANARLAASLKAQLAKSAADGVTVVTDEMTGSGFSVKLDGGRVEHSFTGDVVAKALAKRLRADLAALVK